MSKDDNNVGIGAIADTFEVVLKSLSTAAEAAALPKVNELAPLHTWVPISNERKGPRYICPSDYLGAYDTGAGVLLTTEDDRLLFLPGHVLRRSSEQPNMDPQTNTIFVTYDLWGESAAAESELQELRNKLAEAGRLLVVQAGDAAAQRASLEQKVESLDQQKLNLETKLVETMIENRQLRAELAAGGLSSPSGEVGNLSELHDAAGGVSEVPEGAGATKTIWSKDSEAATRTVWSKIRGK